MGSRVPARLDALVTANRFTIAVVFPLVGAMLLLASAEGWLPAPLSFNPWLVLFGVAVMRLPLIAGILPLVDRRVAAVLVAVVGYVYAIEYLGVTTGWPYGEFAYGVALGPMLGGVPVGLPLFFLPLVLDGLLLVVVALRSGAGRRLVRLPLAVAVVIGVDLVLDPGAVALGFWTYLAGGPYYGVPLSNFLGWTMSALLVVAALDWALWGPAFRARVDRCPFILDDLVSFVLLWGAINAFYGQWLPVAIAAGFGAALLRSGRITVPRHRGEIVRVLAGVATGRSR